MVRTKITNPSASERTHVAEVTYPAERVSEFGTECSVLTEHGTPLRAVRGNTHGHGTRKRTVYRVQAPIDGSQVILGSLVNQEHRDAGPFEMHPWVTDDPVRFVPSIHAMIRDTLTGQSRVVHSTGIDELDTIEETPMHRLVRAQVSIPAEGLFGVLFLKFLHRDPVVPMRVGITWSDDTDPSPSKTFEYLGLSFGEPSTYQFDEAHGVQPALAHEGRLLHVLNVERITLKHGGTLPIGGAVLATPQDAGANTDPEQNPDVASLLAAQAGGLRGLCVDEDGWDGRFLANGNIARLSPEAGFDEEFWTEDALAFQHIGYQGHQTPRPHVCSKTPGQTGAQDDFGAVKATHAVVGHDPNWLEKLQWCIESDFFRGVQQREPDGSPITAVGRPGRITWSGYPHYLSSVSPDQDGKAASLSSAGGWLMYDDQHRSQKSMAAYLALTDDPLVQELIAAYAQNDAMAYRVRYPNYGTGAARAQGRVAGTLSALASVAPPETSRLLLAVRDARLEAVHNGPDLHTGKPMQVLESRPFDYRKQVFLDPPVRNEQGHIIEGNYAPWASGWEHGLALVELYASWKLTPDHEHLPGIVRAVADFLLTFGFFEHDDTWFTVADLAWNDGEPPIGFGDPNSYQTTHAPGIGGVLSWTFAGILAAREILGSEHPRSADCDRYITAMTGNKDATSITQAEWWAVVRSMTPEATPAVPASA